MYGAIIGDIIGSAYERHPVKSTDFPLFTKYSRFTDDSVMTTAVEQWLLSTPDPLDATDDALAVTMRDFGRRYPHRGFGGQFRVWLTAPDYKPYHSFGNGSAMRASGTGWAADTMADVRTLARRSAEVTHNHPEGIKGAEAVAAAILLARQGKSKEDIKAYVETEFGYDLHRHVADIRPTYHFNSTCQGSVGEAIVAFLDSKDYEDCIRLAVSLGGDADTQACIAGAVAEAFYGGVPEALLKQALPLMTDEIRDVEERFYKRFVKQGAAE